NVLPLKLDHHRATVGRLLQKSLGDELPKRFPDRRPATAELFRERNFGNGSAGAQLAAGYLLLNQQVGSFANRPTSGSGAGGRCAFFHGSSIHSKWSSGHFSRRQSVDNCI